MIEDKSCPYCELWREEIGPGYGMTIEGKIAPIKIIHMTDTMPTGIDPHKPLHYTPTFVLMVDDKEASRLLGYPGADFFYPHIQQMLKSAGLLPSQP